MMSSASSETKDVKASINFIDSRILKLKIDNTVPFLGSVLDFSCSVDYKINDLHPTENGTDGVIILFLSILSKEKKKKIFSLELIIEGAFSCDKKIPESVFMDFLRLNGVSTLYSIARGNIMTISGLSYPGVTIRLPMVNIVALNKLKDEAAQKKKE